MSIDSNNNSNLIFNNLKNNSIIGLEDSIISLANSSNNISKTIDQYNTSNIINKHKTLEKNFIDSNYNYNVSEINNNKSNFDNSILKIQDNKSPNTIKNSIVNNKNINKLNDSKNDNKLNINYKYVDTSLPENNNNKNSISNNYDKSCISVLLNKNLDSEYYNENETIEFWKNMCFSMIKDSIQYENTILNLFEENRIYQEYVVSLEDKISKILIKTNNITSDYHKHLNYLNNIINELNQSIKNKDSITLELNRNDIINQEIIVLKNTINDYKSQLDILAEEKETLTSNLSLSRHQCIQATIKLEEIQNSSKSFKENLINHNK